MEWAESRRSRATLLIPAPKAQKSLSGRWHRSNLTGAFQIEQKRYVMLFLMSLCSNNKFYIPWNTSSPFYRYSNTPQWLVLQRYFGREGGRRISPQQVSWTPSSYSDHFSSKMCRYIGELLTNQIWRYPSMLTNRLGYSHLWNAWAKVSFRSLQKVSIFISTKHDILTLNLFSKFRFIPLSTWTSGDTVGLARLERR